MEGGLIALVNEGDIISIDIPNGQLNLEISNEELEENENMEMSGA